MKRPGMVPMLAMFLFAGIMSSVTFGGSVPAILLNTPGTPQNAATCFDGYPMAQRGEGARAIAVSATACFVGSVGGAAETDHTNNRTNYNLPLLVTQARVSPDG